VSLVPCSAPAADAILCTVHSVIGLGVMLGRLPGQVYKSHRRIELSYSLFFYHPLHNISNHITMTERNFSDSWADDLDQTLSAHMKSENQDPCNDAEVRLSIDEPHELLEGRKPEGTSYSFLTRKDAVEDLSWWLKPSGNTKALPTGMWLNFLSKGSAYQVGPSWVHDGTVQVSCRCMTIVRWSAMI
jgi:hypothetical protein